MSDADRPPGRVAEFPVATSETPRVASGQPSAGGWRNSASWLVPPAIYLGMSLLLYSEFVAHPDRGVPGGADGVLYAWYFEHVERAITSFGNPLFSTAINAPNGVNIMWNTAVLAVAVLMAPLTALFGPLVSVNIAMVFAPVLSAMSAYYALRRLTGAVWGAALAATLYGFGPYFQGQSGHLHLIVAFFPPLLLLAAHEVVVAQQVTWLRAGVRLGVLTGVALLVSEEIVALTAVVTVFGVALLAALYADAVAGRVAYAWRATGVGAATAVVIAGIPLAFQFLGPLALRNGVLPSMQKLDLAGVVRPSELQLWASAADIDVNRQFPANTVENTGYLGWPLLILAIGVGAWFALRGDRIAMWLLAITAVTITLSVGSPVEVNLVDIGRGPWAVLRHVPLMQGAVAVRFTLITTLLVALILAYGLSKLRSVALGVGCLVVALAFLPLLPADRYGSMLVTRTPRFFATSAVDVIPPGSNVVILPRGGDPGTEGRAMFWQIRAGLRFDIIGGYSVFNDAGQMTYIAPDPPFARVLQDVGERGVLPTPEDLAGARASIRESDARFVIITDQQQRADLVAVAAEQLTGCTVRRVADVRLCEIPHGP